MYYVDITGQDLQATAPGMLGARLPRGKRGQPYGAPEVLAKADACGLRARDASERICYGFVDEPASLFWVELIGGQLFEVSHE